MNRKAQPVRRSTPSASSASTKTASSTKRDHSAVARKAWQTRRANEAARREAEIANFKPKRRELVAETVEELKSQLPTEQTLVYGDPIEQAFDRAIQSPTKAELQRRQFWTVYTTAVTVIAGALAIALLAG